MSKLFKFISHFICNNIFVEWEPSQTHALVFIVYALYTANYLYIHPTLEQNRAESAAVEMCFFSFMEFNNNYIILLLYLMHYI